MSDTKDIFVSIVAPAYNEEGCIADLLAECLSAGRATGKPFEIVIANDANKDRTGEILDELRAKTPELRVLDMVRNSGQTAALAATLKAAKGKYIATLDADLQNDPADIPRLLDILEKGETDYINGWRASRKDKGWRLIVSKYGNAFRNWITRETIHDSGCGLKVFRRECVADIKLFNGGHRFFVSYVRMEGFRVSEEVVNHRPRTTGQAKYGFIDRVFKVIKDAFVIRWMQNKHIRTDATERT